MTLTTPALLFPAISLLLLAYTNRFLVLAQLIRQLRQMDSEEDHALIARQISMLRKRILLTKRMQTYGVLSFFVCTVSMFVLFLGIELAGAIAFGISLILLSISLLYSLYEIVISTNAINVELENFEVRKQGEAAKQGTDSKSSGC
ncbi:DUF2721 domain-containing protein [Marinobacter sp.]|uniref:DUF2721 domain-containing protein n=1 Tax=Marinobacter sp. TaxID=50741 RepID=UPI002B47D8B3|nr:DUF2721 domain-containing protein [Marinobacter sp.]HKK54742.1 DUF2721 domain-containing protein [Marinobacter sp.]